MKIVIIIVIIIIVLAAAALIFFWMSGGPDVSKYETLKDPRITDLPDRRVIEVSVRGQPEKVLPGAFKVLMETYYKLKGVPKGPEGSAPCLRCPRLKPEQEFETDPYWQGRVAMAVPETITSLPPSAAKSGMDINLTTWDYGLVAEILHVGPYEAEVPTIEKLEAFIKEQGYSIIGDHEEEYLKGPGMGFVNPRDYYTIIRYRITKNEGDINETRIK